MKKSLLLSLFVSLALTSCQKIDFSLIGNWQLSQTNYLITANQDFIFTDVFGSPWQGSIKIDNKEYDSSAFELYFDNTWGQLILMSENMRFYVSGPKLEIEYQNKTYLLDNAYIFDMATGVFKANGVAGEGDEKISVSLNVTMPKVRLKKGEQILIQDRFSSIPYRKIELKNGGKAQMEYLTGDIMENLSGNWEVNNQHIIIQTKNKSENTYSYKLKGNLLLLSQEKNINADELPYHISPFADMLSTVTYQAIYARQ